MFSYMKVHCPICKTEMNGMKGVGRKSPCCDLECYKEWEWRETLAIMGKEYYPRKGSRWDATAPDPTCADLAAWKGGRDKA